MNIKQCLLSLLIFFTGVTFVAGSEETRSTQQKLKEQGFYYGEVDGNTGPETTGAIRRFQIRNGLDVTGSLNDETREALGFSPIKAPDNPVITQAAKEDREFLEKQQANKAPLPSAPIRHGYGLSELFRNTPYSSAPPEVQENTLRRAQVFLGRSGFYRGNADGVYGRDTERAILSFQRSSYLQETGKLDMETLGGMNLLPDRVVPYGDYPAPQRGRRVIRGIWIR